MTDQTVAAGHKTLRKMLDQYQLGERELPTYAELRAISASQPILTVQGRGDTCACHVCGKPTTMTATKLCDGCYELGHDPVASFVPVRTASAPQSALAQVGSIGDDPEFLGRVIAAASAVMGGDTSGEWQNFVDYIDSRIQSAAPVAIAPQDRNAVIEEVAQIWDSSGKETWIARSIRALKDAAPASTAEIDDDLFFPPKAALKREDWDTATRKPKIVPASATAGQREATVAALTAARQLIDSNASEHGYGFARPANPHDFHPDGESCSADEIAAHKAACEAFDKGEYTPKGGCKHEGGMHVLVAPWGIGSYTFRDEQSDVIIAQIDAALAASPVAAPKEPLTRCAAARDGDCTHPDCPQLRDNEPQATGRHCPIDTSSEDE